MPYKESRGRRTKRKKSRKVKKNRVKTYKKGGGLWDSIKNALSNNNPDTAQPNTLDTAQPNTLQLTPPPTQPDTEFKQPTNSGGCVKHKHVKKSLVRK